MAYLSWWQMIRVLAGREPGDPDIPSTDLDPQPEAVTALLAEGKATVLGRHQESSCSTGGEDGPAG